MNKIQVRMEDFGSGEFKFNILDFIDCLDEEGKNKVLEYFVFSQVIDSIERQLKHKTDCDSWDTSGWRDGQKLREHILKIQGLEPEFKKDMESRIRSLERESANYKKYYDWYFKLHHHGFDCLECRQGESIMDKAKKAIGDVK